MAFRFRGFRALCGLRVLLLAGSIALGLYLLRDPALYVTAALVGAAVVYQVISLIRFVETTNRATQRFLQTVVYADFSENISTALDGASFEELDATFADLTARFRELNLEKEETLHYLRMIVRDVSVGLIAYDEQGRVELVNAAAKRLLGVPLLKDVAALERTVPALAARLAELRSGRRELVKLRRDDELMQLSLHATELRLRKKKIRLLTLQNISAELDEKEMEAWQNLVRVLTHEIKNSLTPIASLASTVEQLLAADAAEVDADVREALRTIRKRSHGLLEFVDAYRDLTRIPQPELAVVPIAELIGRAEQLVSQSLRGQGIAFTVEVEPETLELTADPRLIEQVLLNLLMNAIEALHGRPGGEIAVTARLDERGRTVVSVTDNGPGIIAEVLDKVFVPFFSTKAGGSGIGLSLSRQIMRRHRGELLVHSIPGRETSFVMRL